MTKYVLFSPVSGTDPIGNYADGPMLHICRVYKPHKVYLYLSKEMVDRQNNDERYTKCLEKLSDHLGYKFQVELIIRPLLKEVHLYESFYGEFEEQIRTIQQENQDSTLILNVSSGTPAMQATLLTLAAIAEQYRALAVQVSTPVKAQNPRNEDKNNFDIDLYWECNEDNKDNFTNRCMVQKHVNIPVKMKIKVIENHIKCYDYTAALAVAKEIAFFITPESMKLLKAAIYRIQLNQSDFDKVMNEVAADYDFIPVKKGDQRKLFEAILWLQIKQKRGDYVDFLRGITPVVMGLFEFVLKENDIDIARFCKTEESNGGHVYKLKREIMEQSPEGREILKILDNSFKPSFKNCIYTSAHLILLIKNKLTDEKLIDKAVKLRETEQKARNVAAHTIVAVNDEWMKSKVNCNSQDILDAIKYIAQHSFIRSPQWNSFDKMNEIIITEINKRVR